MPLTSASAGQDVLVTAIGGGRRIKARLAALGICPGRPLTIINDLGRGQIIVRSNGATFALGQGMSKKIHVI